MPDLGTRLFEAQSSKFLIHRNIARVRRPLKGTELPLIRINGDRLAISQFRYDGGGWPVGGQSALKDGRFDQ